MGSDHVHAFYIKVFLVSLLHHGDISMATPVTTEETVHSVEKEEIDHKLI